MNSLKEIIFTRIGLASMCWSETPNGVFNSGLATKAGDDIVRAAEDYAKRFVDWTVENNWECNEGNWEHMSAPGYYSTDELLKKFNEDENH